MPCPGENSPSPCSILKNPGEEMHFGIGSFTARGSTVLFGKMQTSNLNTKQEF
jgi:hypothetical protein